MTYPPPQNPYGQDPQGQPPNYGTPPGQPPAYGAPQGQPPAYGTPPGQTPPTYGGQPDYGTPPQYGATPQGYGAGQYGAPQAYGTQGTGLASWLQRVGSYIIDSLVTAPFAVLAAIFGTGENANGAQTVNAFYFIMIFAGLVVSGYNRWYLGGKTGQSWGKKALGITLVGEQTGAPIGPLKAFLRDLAHIVDSIICNIGYLWPLWDEKKQTLADKIMKTVVRT